jgi:nitrogen fixation/metabolism regulation signal transduction histidine kinase
LNTGVISCDAENRVTTINKSATDMLRLEAGQFVGFTLENLVGEENRAVLEKLFARAKRIGFATEQTVLLREDVEISGENGSVPVALTATALPARRDGRAGGMVLVIEDLTELISAQRASAWQEVARRMAHEIKNPLTPIQLSAERIAKRFAAAEKNGELTGVISESTETILREVDSLKSMVDEFSRFARLPNVKLEAGDIAEVIGQSLAGYEDREGVKIETEFSANLPSVMIDSEQMRRVFVNLIENAIEAFDRDQPDKQIRLTARFEPARDLVVAEVSDNGNGIAPQNLQRLFQPYFSTKGRGTGLGLAIVQRIIAEHHGKIRAAANQPKGAKFIVELPANV